MKCSAGYQFSVFVSDDGIVHSFGSNECGQLGLGHQQAVTIPTQVPTLPKIKLISSGAMFTVCLDYEGIMWKFGDYYGSIGEANANFLPRKIENVPHVTSISCGAYHLLFITQDENLWSGGDNECGQLCRDAKENYSPHLQQTLFSNILQIFAGDYCSLFQNNNWEIYGCGNNEEGQLGLGHYNHPQLEVCLVKNQPPNITFFSCGYGHSLFLDTEGNVFSVGDNENGSLGLGHKENRNILEKISNIPPIQKISCINRSSYLLDYEGHIWSFGKNGQGILGHNDKLFRDAPSKMFSPNDIIQISFACSGNQFFAKDSNKKIFVCGKNLLQLGGNTDALVSLTELPSEYSTIWGAEFKSRAKSARK